MIEGILQPAFSHQFKVTFIAAGIQDNDLSNGVTRTSYDIATKSATCTLIVPLVGRKYEKYIALWCNDSGAEYLIEYLNPHNGCVAHSVKLQGLTTTKCLIDLDYASHDVIHMNLEFNYTDFVSTHNVLGKEVLA